jgi:hypothetical protein
VLKIWVTYDGATWEAAGRAVREEASRFERVGDYKGFDVFRARSDVDHLLIYLPARNGTLAPYRRVP